MSGEEMRLWFDRDEAYTDGERTAIAAIHQDVFGNQVVPVSLELFRQMISDLGFRLEEADRVR